MERRIDARGLACPAPVLQTKDALEKDRPDIIRILVDNEAARQNVSRFLASQKYGVTVEGEANAIELTGSRLGEPIPEQTRRVIPEPDRKKTMVMVTASHVGHGDDELGSKLMVSFLKTLKEMGPELWRLVFLNSGVTLTVEDSEALPLLKELEDEGVHILVCGTCLNHFHLLDRKKTGETTNMLDIVTAMQLADKVISI